jgi:hypothetical protein
VSFKETRISSAEFKGRQKSRYGKHRTFRNIETIQGISSDRNIQSEMKVEENHPRNLACQKTSCLANMLIEVTFFRGFERS